VYFQVLYLPDILHLPDFGRYGTACHWAFQNLEGTVFNFNFSFSFIVIFFLLLVNKDGPMQPVSVILVSGEIRSMPLLQLVGAPDLRPL
jgi:hypothetical protein